MTTQEAKRRTISKDAALAGFMVAALIAVLHITFAAIFDLMTTSEYSKGWRDFNLTVVTGILGGVVHGASVGKAVTHGFAARYIRTGATVKDPDKQHREAYEALMQKTGLFLGSSVLTGLVIVCAYAYELSKVIGVEVENAPASMLVALLVCIAACPYLVIVATRHIARASENVLWTDRASLRAAS